MSFGEKVENEVQAEPRSEEIDSDEWKIARERLKSMKSYVGISINGDALDRYDLIDHMKKETGTAKMFVEMTMHGIRAFKELDEEDKPEVPEDSKKRTEPIARTMVRQEKLGRNNEVLVTKYRLLPANQSMNDYHDHKELLERHNYDVERLGNAEVEPYSSIRVRDFEEFCQQIKECAVNLYGFENLNSEEKEVLEEVDLSYE